MEQFEMVEKLVNTFGVSYEKAKEALEASNWDAIDAAIYLEKEKKGEPQPVKEEIPVQPQQETVQEEPAEEPVKEEPQPQAKVNTEPKGSTFSSSTRSAVDDMKKEGSKFFKTIWDFLSLNSFVVKKSSGEVFLDIPIWLMALLLCSFFWAVIFILVIVFIMGYRFTFKGPQLGKKNIKNAVSRAESATEDFVEKVKATVAPDNVEPVESETVTENVVETVAEKTESIIENAEKAVENAVNEAAPAEEQNEEKDSEKPAEPTE